MLGQPSTDKTLRQHGENWDSIRCHHPISSRAQDMRQVDNCFCPESARRWWLITSFLSHSVPPPPSAGPDHKWNKWRCRTLPGLSKVMVVKMTNDSGARVAMRRNEIISWISWRTSVDVRGGRDVGRSGLMDVGWSVVDLEHNFRRNNWSVTGLGLTCWRNMNLFE